MCGLAFIWQWLLIGVLDEWSSSIGTLTWDVIYSASSWFCFSSWQPITKSLKEICACISHPTHLCIICLGIIYLTHILSLLWIQFFCSMIEVVEKQVEVFLMLFLHVLCFIVCFIFLIHLKFNLELVLWVFVRHFIVVPCWKIVLFILLLPELSMISLIPSHMRIQRKLLTAFILEVLMIILVIIGLHRIASIQVIFLITSYILLSWWNLFLLFDILFNLRLLWP